MRIKERKPRAADELTNPDVIISPCKDCGKMRLCDRASRRCLDRYKSRGVREAKTITVYGCYTKSSESNDYA